MSNHLSTAFKAHKNQWGSSGHVVKTNLPTGLPGQTLHADASADDITKSAIFDLAVNASAFWKAGQLVAGVSKEVSSVAVQFKQSSFLAYLSAAPAQIYYSLSLSKVQHFGTNISSAKIICCHVFILLHPICHFETV